VEEGRKPYVIPVGGSNSLGTWYCLIFLMLSFMLQLHVPDFRVYGIVRVSLMNIIPGLGVSIGEVAVTAILQMDISPFFYGYEMSRHLTYQISYKQEDLGNISYSG
jgi:hypothetical protein